ncbi:101L [Cherax quadricarinatus iridovirus]|uniref:Uncharacterized protein n=1 Tax=Shrimp hemocyte iridescent virus TaxID=2039780 RepID=A0A291B0N8_9VIRU|nr:101L [Cherax quadricarinatus iridovirus]YP_010084805.1 hypothetical protein KM509_gp053 [Shrimp hemocyte iridescent virus]ASZ85081.1 101L [Cherax quadricarinatus iridovirus]ATE87062.1 hypothetical protein [Shrimp hemocyte iridescent virus]
MSGKISILHRMMLNINIKPKYKLIPTKKDEKENPQENNVKVIEDKIYKNFIQFHESG